MSLDPYRLESRKILQCIKDALPKDAQKVEKASVDEVFMDLSKQVHDRLLQRFPEELSGPPPYDDSSERLPIPGVTVLDWKADALIDLDEGRTEEEDPDWDDVAILIGSEIVREVRAAVRAELKYTISGGIAQNKMLAKLGSAHKKPNQQTIVRNRAVQQFLSEFKFTKIRGLGGKLGEQITSAFSTETVKDLLPVPIEQLKQKLGDDTGTWVHQIIRGIDNSEVNPRTQIKSMLSAKSFRPSINHTEQAHRWLRIFVADIFSRLLEEGVVENKRRPKTMTLHCRSGGQTKSRQAPISLGKKIDEIGLFEIAKTLLGQTILEGRVWPCANLSLSVGGFEDGVSGNMGIGAFLIKGEEAKAINSLSRESSTSDTPPERPEKRRRIDKPAGISRFLVKAESTEDHDDDFGSQDVPIDEEDLGRLDADVSVAESGRTTSHANTHEDLQKDPPRAESTLAVTAEVFVCERCGAKTTSSEEQQSHQDWHFAKDLYEEDRNVAQPVPATSKPNLKRHAPAATKKKTGHSKPEKGQSKLAFG